jgi:small subunit ribosomal protein S11
MQKSSVKKKKLSTSYGVVHIQARFNNTIITITDTIGNTITSSSGGSSGFKGGRKSTPYAAQLASQNAAKRCVERGLKEVEVRISGPGGARETALRALQTSGLSITFIRDVTPLPHNGCRAPKKRRL